MADTICERLAAPRLEWEPCPLLKKDPDSAQAYWGDWFLCVGRDPQDKEDYIWLVSQMRRRGHTQWGRTRGKKAAKETAEQWARKVTPEWFL